MAENPQQHAQKIMQLMNSGQFPAAIKAAKTAFRKFPREGLLANMVGMAMAQSGQEREAISFFSKALKLRPGDADIQNNLIQALVGSDQHTKANDLIDKLIAKRGEDARLWQLKATSFLRQGQPDKVVEYASNAINIEPKFALAYNLRGIAHTELGHDADAVADFQTAHELNPKDPDPLANAGLPLSRLDRNEEAMEVVEKALAMRPDHVNALHRHAVQLVEMGRIEESIARYNDVLNVDPFHGEAYSELVKTQDTEANRALEPKLRHAISKTPKKAPMQVYFNLGMGNLLFQRGDYEKAAPYLAASNALAAQQRPYDAAAAELEFEQTRALFPVGDTLPDAGDRDTPRPIFVLGQPRSGTTLSEMILSAHPDVVSGGELPLAGRLAPPILNGVQDFDPSSFAADFRKGLPAFQNTAQAFVDKMPANYRYIGFLLHSFPDAPILHIERDPRDVALSMWRTHFPSGWMNFTFDLKAMAHSANLYKRYMQHWQTLYGDRIISMNYKDIVHDVEGASRKMAEGCGLDWIPAMAAPQDNTARVRTASVVQVREGVHTKSVGGWERMASALGPFIQELDPALWPELEF